MLVRLPLTIAPAVHMRHILPPHLRRQKPFPRFSSASLEVGKQSVCIYGRLTPPHNKHSLQGVFAPLTPLERYAPLVYFQACRPKITGYVSASHCQNPIGFLAARATRGGKKYNGKGSGFLNKSKMFCFRLSEKDYLSIQRKADKAKLNMTAYITMSALQKQIIVIDGLEKIIGELKSIGRNINQLTTLCNMGKIQSVGLAEIKERFGAVFDAIMDLYER